MTDRRERPVENGFSVLVTLVRSYVDQGDDLELDAADLLPHLTTMAEHDAAIDTAEMSWADSPENLLAALAVPQVIESLRAANVGVWIEGERVTLREIPEEGEQSDNQ